MEWEENREGNRTAETETDGFTVRLETWVDECPDTSWLGDWGFVGMTAKAYRAGVELGFASLGGIESDSADAYFDEVAADLISESVEEAKKALVRLEASNVSA